MNNFDINRGNPRLGFSGHSGFDMRVFFTSSVLTTLDNQPIDNFSNCLPRKSQWYRLMRDQLRVEDFLKEDDSVVSLENSSRGKMFVKALSRFVPYGWDLIDVLDQELPEGVCLDFGPRLDEKFINGSLRSLGMYRERWEGSKSLALFHPFSDRLNKLKMAVERMDRLLNRVRENGKMAIEDNVLKGILNDKNNIEKWAPRLEVELCIAELYLERTFWFSNLLKKDGSNSEEMRRLLKDLVMETKDTFALFQECDHFFESQRRTNSVGLQG